MPSLTHAEALDRAHLLTVHSYVVEVDLTCGDAVFESVSTVRFDCRTPGATTFAELRGRPLSVSLNGRPLPAECVDGRLALPELGPTNELVVRAEFDYSHTGEGLHRFVDPADGGTYVYAMSFLDSAPRIFCCFDQPDLKAPVTLAVTAPQGWAVLANESSVSSEPVPAEREERGGPDRDLSPAADAGAPDRVRWQFRTTRPVATYMTTLCAGPFHSRYRSHDGIRLGWHCRRSLAAHLDAEADELFEVTAQSFDAYHALFEVRYPFGDGYDQVFVPEFNAGAMENPGCVTFRDEMLFRSAVTDAEREARAAVVAHEMAHMWFGDLVTMRWWDDLWLNESFATYLGYRVTSEATRFRTALAGFAGGRKLDGYRADQSSWTHPVAPADVPDAAHALLNFDAISYPKGASVLRQLAAFLGDAFLAGLRTHFAKHAYGNATLADLFDSLSEASGQDLRVWAELWLRRSGVDTLVPSVETDPAGRYTSVLVRQTAPAGVPLRPHRIGVGVYRRDAAGALHRDRHVSVELDPASDGGQTAVTELVGAPGADLLLLNDEDLTFATVRLTSADAGRLTDLLPALSDPMARALLWTAAWDMTRSAELPARDFVDLVGVGLVGEPQLSLARTMLNFARSFVTDRVLPPPERDAALQVLSGACTSLLSGAAPGSGVQLAAAQGLVDCATDAEGARLAAWLRADGVPDGLTVDAELRWRILHRLVVLGVVGPAEIEAEAAGDPTAQGQVHATRCRAALPDPVAKHDAWSALMGDRSLSNRQLGALGSGFWQPEQRELTAQYVARYFAGIVAATADRSTEMATLLANVAYPRFAVDAATADASTELLGRPDVPAAVRRSVTAHRDELVVALSSRRTGPS